MNVGLQGLEKGKGKFSPAVSASFGARREQRIGSSVPRVGTNSKWVRLEDGKGEKEQGEGHCEAKAQEKLERISSATEGRTGT